MRFSFIDLAILTAFLLCGCIAVPFVFRMGGFPPPSLRAKFAIGDLIGAAAYLALSPPINLRLRLLPLRLSPCPHCGRLPGGYRVIQARWPSARVRCGLCDRDADCWMRRPDPGAISREVPGLLLCWPQSIGRWRRIDRN